MAVPAPALRIASYDAPPASEEEELRLDSSKDLDETAPLPLPHPPFFDLSSSLEVDWMFSESYSSSFCFLFFLPFSLFVFFST